MARHGDNKPTKVLYVEMSPELAEFVIENCDSNIPLGLQLMQGASEGMVERLVVMNEHFKALKKAVIAAKG